MKNGLARECQEVCVNENPFSWQNKVLIEK